MRSRGRNRGFLLAETVILAVLLLAWSVLDHGGLTAADWSGFLLAAAPLALVSMAQTVPILAGGQGLAAGATVLLVNILLGSAPIETPGAALLWIAIGLLVGGGIGVCNGLLVGYLKLPSTAVTYATGIAVGAFAYGVAENGGVTQQPEALTALLFGPELFSLPVIPLALVLVTAAGGFLFQRARLGRALRLAGERPLLAEHTLPVARMRCIAYGLAGLGYGAAGILLAGQLGAMDSMLGTPVLVQIFAAVTLAGNCPGLRAGSIPGALLGAGIVAATANLLIPLGLPDILSPALDSGWLLLGLIGCAIFRDHPPRVVRRTVPAFGYAIPLAALGVLLLSALAAFRPEASGVAIVGAGLALLAIGQGAVMRAGGFDLAMPAMIAASGVATVALSQGGLGRFMMALIAIVLAAIGLGLWHGFLARRLGRAVILATLASSGILQAVAASMMVWLPTGFAPPVLTALVARNWLGLPLTVWILLPTAIVIAVLLDRRGKGLPVAYVTSALSAAAFGVLIACFGGTFRLGLVDVYLVPTVAAVVLGGIDFIGGRGTLLAVVGAALILQVADTLMVAVGLSYESRLAALAALILLRSAAARFRAPRTSA